MELRFDNKMQETKTLEEAKFFLNPDGTVAKEAKVRSLTSAPTVVVCEYVDGVIHEDSERISKQEYEEVLAKQAEERKAYRDKRQAEIDSAKKKAVQLFIDQGLSEEDAIAVVYSK